MRYTLNELDALLRLLEDPHSEVFTAVYEKLINLGDDITSRLEQRWEETSNQLVQERIENILREIQHNQVIRELKSWKQGGAANLLYGAFLVARVQYPDLQYDQLNIKVEEFKRDVWLELNDHLTALEKVRVMNFVFFNLNKIIKPANNKLSPQHFLINHLLDTRNGSAILIGLLYGEVARRLEIPVFGVSLPGNYLLCYQEDSFPDDPDGIHFYINPAGNGGISGRKAIEAFYNNQKILVSPDEYRPCGNIQTLIHLIRQLDASYLAAGIPDKQDYLKNLLRVLKPEFSPLDEQQE
ncbi:MAG: transglutaminase family protein [Bacteroidota bacterium]